MKYRSERLGEFDFSCAFVERGEADGTDITIYIGGAYYLGTSLQNPSGKDMSVIGLKAVLRDCEIKNVSAQSRKILNIKNNSVREEKERKLYKSELAEFTDRLCLGGADIFSLSDSEGEICMELNFDGNASEECLFTVNISCYAFSLEWEDLGEVRPRKKLTLRQRADMLKTEIPAIFLALGKKETPQMAKITAALAVGYALSPIDLVPDFIPVFGYLDDILILPGLVYMSVRLIPKEVMEECRKEAAGLWVGGRPKKWFYALPVVIIWLLVLMGIISIFL